MQNTIHRNYDSDSDKSLPRREHLKLWMKADINENWNDNDWFFQFYLGISPDEAAEQWLLSEGWQQRVRVAEAYFRNGGFRIVPQSNGVLLLRSD